MSFSIFLHIFAFSQFSFDNGPQQEAKSARPAPKISDAAAHCEIDSAQFLCLKSHRAVQSDAQRDKNYSALSATMQHALTRIHTIKEMICALDTHTEHNK
jgi:hypothetical protein